MSSAHVVTGNRPPVGRPNQIYRPGGSPPRSAPVSGERRREEGGLLCLVWRHPARTKRVPEKEGRKWRKTKMVCPPCCTAGGRSGGGAKLAATGGYFREKWPSLRLRQARLESVAKHPYWAFNIVQLALRLTNFLSNIFTVHTFPLVSLQQKKLGSFSHNEFSFLYRRQFITFLEACNIQGYLR